MQKRKAFLTFFCLLAIVVGSITVILSVVSGDYSTESILAKTTPILIFLEFFLVSLLIVVHHEKHKSHLLRCSRHFRGTKETREILITAEKWLEHMRSKDLKNLEMFLRRNIFRLNYLIRQTERSGDPSALKKWLEQYERISSLPNDMRMKILLGGKERKLEYAEKF